MCVYVYSSAGFLRGLSTTYRTHTQGYRHVRRLHTQEYRHVRPLSIYILKTVCTHSNSDKNVGVTSASPYPAATSANPSMISVALTTLRIITQINVYVRARVYLFAVHNVHILMFSPSLSLSLYIYIYVYVYIFIYTHTLVRTVSNTMHATDICTCFGIKSHVHAYVLYVCIFIYMYTCL